MAKKSKSDFIPGSAEEIAGLRQELAYAEQRGDKSKAAEVRKALESRGGSKGRGKSVEKAVTGPAENTAERTGGVTTDDIGALAPAPKPKRAAKGKAKK